MRLTRSVGESEVNPENKERYRQRQRAERRGEEGGERTNEQALRRLGSLVEERRRRWRGIGGVERVRLRILGRQICDSKTQKNVSVSSGGVMKEKEEGTHAIAPFASATE